MLKFLATLQSFMVNRTERDDEGATMVEYGLMVALVAVVVAVGAGALGIGIDALFDRVTVTLGAV